MFSENVCLWMFPAPSMGVSSSSADWSMPRRGTVQRVGVLPCPNSCPLMIKAGNGFPFLWLFLYPWHGSRATDGKRYIRRLSSCWRGRDLVNGRKTIFFFFSISESATLIVTACSFEMLEVKKWLPKPKALQCIDKCLNSLWQETGSLQGA